MSRKRLQVVTLAVATAVGASALSALSAGFPYGVLPAWSQAKTASAAGAYNAAEEIRLATADLARNSKDGYAYERRGAAYVRQQKWEAAVKDMTEAIKYNPKSPTAYASRGMAYYKLNKLPQALADINKAIQMNPRLAGAYAVRANIYIVQKKYQLAWQDAKEAVRLDPNDQGCQLAYSRAAHYVGQHGASIAACTRVIQKNPRNPTAWDNRGIAYLQMKSYQNAINDFSKAIQLAPGEPKYWCHRGIVYCEVGNYDKAISDLSKAIALKPDYSLALFDRGVSYYRMGKYELAYKDLQLAIHYDPNYALAWQQFPLDPVKSPKNKEKMDEAKDWYYRGTTRLMLMRSTNEPGEVASSINDFKKYLELAGWQAELSQNAVLLCYVCHMRLGQQPQAKGILEEAAAKCDKTQWPYPVVAFLRGEIKEDDLMSQATSPEKETEARAVVALHHWHGGRREHAKGHMDWLQQKGHSSIVSYSLVLRELEKLHPERTMETERYYSHPLH